MDNGLIQARLLALGLLLVMIGALFAFWRRQPHPAPPPLAAEAVQPWMLETAHGIGPATAPRWLAHYQEAGLSALPERAQGDLRGLIADIPAAETPHNSAQ